MLSVFIRLESNKKKINRTNNDNIFDWLLWSSIYWMLCSLYEDSPQLKHRCPTHIFLVRKVLKMEFIVSMCWSGSWCVCIGQSGILEVHRFLQISDSEFYIKFFKYWKHRLHHGGAGNGWRGGNVITNFFCH